MTYTPDHAAPADASDIELVFERNYSRLCQLLGNSWPALDEPFLLTAAGFMDLRVEWLRRGPHGSFELSLAHYFEQNGDLVPDPDMEIRVYPDRELVEALTYQNFLRYQVVYPAPELVDLKAKQDLNHFLDTWLTNLIAQGHRRSPSTLPN